MVQTGGRMMVYRGAPFQQGYGIGSFFSSLARRALPFLQRGVKTLGRAALKTGMNIAGDVLAGKNVKDSTQSQIQQTAKTLKEQALSRFTPQAGSGVKRLKRKKPQKRLSSPQASKVKRPNKTVSKKKKQAPTYQGQVKKSKVTHLQDIFNE